MAYQAVPESWLRALPTRGLWQLIKKEYKRANRGDEEGTLLPDQGGVPEGHPWKDSSLSSEPNGFPPAPRACAW